jgi:hypothetical protein
MRSVDSIALGIMVFVAAWFLMKRFRKKPQATAAPGRPTVAGQSTGGTMPRLGTPGTVTKVQRERLQSEGFEPSRHWSIEEADLVLDTVVYLRGVWKKAVSRQDAPIEIQNSLLAFILTDPEMREYIRRWGAEHRDKGGEGMPAFPRTKIFERVSAEAARIRGEKHEN